MTSLSIFSKEFETEIAQIKYWCNSLQDIKYQLSHLHTLTNQQKNYVSDFSKEISLSLQDYHLTTTSYSKEPSNLYKLTILILSIIEEPSKRNDMGFQALSPTFQTNIPQLTLNIDTMILNIQNTSKDIMSEVSQLKSQSMELQQQYTKSKAMLDDAQMKKKKIENDPTTVYNDKVKEKAETALLKSFQEVDILYNKIKPYSQKIEMKKELFNIQMKETFELVVLTTFKGIVHLHQFFLLLAKHRFDFHNEMNTFISEKINSNLKAYNLVINDYSERKYAESLEIFFEPIHFTHVTIRDEYDNIATLTLIDSYLKYTETFYNCIKMRKRVIVQFAVFLNNYLKNENAFIEKLYQNDSQINEMIRSFEYLPQGTKKIWNMVSLYWNSIGAHHTTFSKYLSSRASHLLKTYRKETKKDYSTFKSQWKKYEKKLIKFKVQSQKFELLKEKKKDKDLSSMIIKYNENDKNMKEFIKKECYEFINQNVKSIRERDRKRSTEIHELAENIMGILGKHAEETIDLTRNITDTVMQIDIFEEVKEIFIQYFEKFNISNYDNFMDTIKIKVLNKIDFENDPVCQDTKKILGLNNNNNSNSNNINTSNEFVNQNHSFFGSDGNDSLLGVKKIAGLSRYSSSSSDTSELNYKDDASEEILFVNKRNFPSIEQKNLDPYKNFKANEIKRLQTKMQDCIITTKAETIDNIVLIEKDEQFIEKFQCYYKPSKSYSGLLYVTSNKIVFNGQNLKISIPLYDIVSISKSDKDLKRPQMIEVKTQKATLFFYGFTDREKIIQSITEQLSKAKDEEGKDISKDNASNNNQNNKYASQLYQRNIEITNLLKKLRFSERLNEINEARMKEFETEFRKESNFSPVSEFHMSFLENDPLSVSPINLVYQIIFNPNTIINELGQGKGFLESVSLNRGDYELTIKEEDNMKNIPRFFDDLDYANNVFSSFDEKELDDFLNEIPKWPKTANFELNFVHPVKMFIGPGSITMRNILTIYFISPTTLIIDYHSYGSNFPYAETFVSITQYHFHTDYNFNPLNGIFSFNTTCSIYFNIKMIKYCFVENMIKSEGYKTTEDETKYKLYEIIKTVLDTESENYNEMYLKLCQENIRKNLHKYSAKFPEGMDINLEEQAAEEERNRKKETEIAEQKKKEKMNQMNSKDTSKVSDNKENKMMLCFAILILIYLIFRLIIDKTKDKTEILFNSLLIIFAGVIVISFWKKK